MPKNLFAVIEYLCNGVFCFVTIGTNSIMVYAVKRPVLPIVCIDVIVIAASNQAASNWNITVFRNAYSWPKVSQFIDRLRFG